MFTIYHSNQLDLLKSLSAELMRREPLSSVFSKEMILVQSNGMAQWLQMQLADELNIAANMDFILPSNFIWQLYSSLLPNVPKNNAFDKASMCWKLMALLPTIIHRDEFSVLQKYLQKNNVQTLFTDQRIADQQITERKYFQLAQRIADIFDQYLVYRPDWILAWEKGEAIAELSDAQIWQSALWRELIQATESLQQSSYHRANIYQQAIDILMQPKLADNIKRHLPERIFIFGITSLPPVYLQSLYALGQHIDVHLMFTNPCRWYWGDIPDQRWLSKLLQTQWRHYRNKTQRGLLKDEQNQFDFFTPVVQSHPILASWGKLGRDNLFLLQDLANKNDIEAFVDLGRETLLHSLQQDILDLDDKMIWGKDEKSFAHSRQKQRLKSADLSLTFHSCHSEQREVEVLYDYLLATLEQEPNLALRDIVIMVADIDRYAPYIQAVFSRAPAERYLPFSISDQKIRRIDPIVEAFLSLLLLPQSRFTTDDLLGLLEVSALAEQFDIDEKQLQQLRRWVVDSGIRWGLNDEMVQTVSTSHDHRHTWNFGLTRMLLGYVMNADQGSWNHILPYEETSGLAAELVGKLAYFLQKLTYWQKRLQTNLSPEEWQTTCHELLSDFFTDNQDSHSVLFLIEQEWLTLINQILTVDYQHSLSAALLHDALQQRLEQTRIDQKFLAGKINFCTMMPMRSIPFKVVCLLGMNDGVYPRTSTPLAFDLLGENQQRGDRSRRDDDRYLFLEALLSAQQRFYISYIGHAIEDNAIRYPSVLVNELREYIAHSYVLKSDESLNIDQSGTKLLEQLTIQHARTPFSPENYRPKTNYSVISYADEWLPAAQLKGQANAFIQTLEPIEITRISLDELIRFYRHSLRELLQKRLGIYFAHYDDRLPDAENFDLDGLTRYQINQQLLEILVENPDDANTVFQRVYDAGILPYGVFGEIAWQEQYQEISKLAEQIRTQRNEPGKLEVQINLNNIELQGWLTHVQQNGLLRSRPGKLSIYDGMSLWIEHLCYCIVNNHHNCTTHSSLYLGLKESQWQFNSVEKSEAEHYLSMLIKGYCSGMNTPLILPLKSAWAWLETVVDKQTLTITQDQSTHQKARQKLITQWQGAFAMMPECDEYYQRVYPELTDPLVKSITDYAAEYLLPLMRYLNNQSIGS